MMKNNITFQEIWDLATIARFDQSKIDIPVFNNPVLDSFFAVEKKTIDVTAFKLRRFTKSLEYSFKEFFSGQVIQLDSGCDCISIFLDYLARPQRYEPENVYKLHTLVPTVRTTFPYEFLILLSNAGKSRIYKYHPSYHALELVEERDSITEKNGDISIICRALYWKLAQRYGEYSPYLVHLEAGAIKTMIIQMLTLFGFNGIHDDVHFIKPGFEDRTRQNFEHEVLKISARSLFDWSKVLDLESGNIKATVLGDECNLASRFPKLQSFIDHFHASETEHNNLEAGKYSAVKATNSNPNYQPKFSDYFKALHARSAANDSSGVTSLLLNPGISIMQNVCGLADQLDGVSAQVLASELIAVNYLAIQSENSNEKGLFDNQAKKIFDDFNVVDVLTAALPNKVIKINFTSMVGMFLLVIDPELVEKKYPNCAARYIHQAAGAKMLNLSIAASAYGFYVRPMRMLLEHVIEAKLGIEGKIIFQIVLGYKRRTNLSFRL